MKLMLCIHFTSTEKSKTNASGSLDPGAEVRGGHPTDPAGGQCHPRRARRHQDRLKSNPSFLEIYLIFVVSFYMYDSKGNIE